MFYYNVVPFMSIDAQLTYSFNRQIEVGSLVTFKVRNKHCYGVIVKCLEAGVTFDYEVKQIDEIILEHYYSKPYIEFLTNVTNYNISKIGDIFSLGFYKNFFAEKIQKQHREELLIPKINLSNLQQKALENFNKIGLNDFKVFALKGETGSGKTAIYLKLILDYLEKNQENVQILILLPEIALSEELSRTIEEKYHINTLVWHSKKKNSYKKHVFEKIINNEKLILIGTRSALFLPYKNLKMIILDEEHDYSYKQDEYPYFHARDMSILLAQKLNIAAILVSATPSIETYHNIKSKKFHLVEIEEKYFHNNKNKIYTIKPEANKIISDEALEIVKEKFKLNKQILIFLNRRGYASVVECQKCKSSIMCKNCNLTMHFHAKQKQLICHCCNYLIDYENSCKVCSSKLKITGKFGVELLHEVMLNQFPEANILTLSSDLIAKEEERNDYIKKIHQGDVDIIIATQIISKGYHFAKLNDLMVIDDHTIRDDIDFRINERLFQMFYQLNGRIAREDAAGGNIYLQTINNNSAAINSILENNSVKFYETELEKRLMAKMSPFYLMVSVDVCSKNQKEAQFEAKMFAGQLKKMSNSFQFIEILGPVESSIFFIKAKYFYKIILKFKKEDSARDLKVYKHFLKNYKKTKTSVDIYSNVNPYIFF